MNKLKALRKTLMREAAIAGAVLGFCFALTLASGMLAASGEKTKNEANAQFAKDQSELSNLKNQINTSGTAEKRFLEISAGRNNDDYVADSDAMKTLLREAKNTFRFADNFKLTLAPVKGGDKPEFAGLNYDVSIREPMRIELSAMSDIHVFSFIQHLQAQAPGIIKFTRMELKRTADMDTVALTAMSGGQIKELADATLEFTWLGVAPKKSNPVTPPAAGTP